MAPQSSILLAMGLALTFAACEGEGGVVNEETLPRTTNPEIAVANLNGQIDALTRQVAIAPTNTAARESLVGLLMARTQYLGTFEDFDSAFAIVNEALEMEIEPARIATLHASLLSAVHRFDLAIEELDRAEALGGRAQPVLRQTIGLARGVDSERIAQEREAAVSLTASFSTLSGLAAAYRSLERYEESDLAYQDALGTYRDVSPFPHAWVSFQRGVMWGEFAGDAETAYGHYVDAVAVLPQYVVGNVHLAELEVAHGDSELAIERLERIVFETDDPEPASRLAQFLAPSDPAKSQDYAAYAKQQYEHYLATYPLAFADHACEFYLAAGADSDRALELALLNLDNRKTPRAYDLALTSASAAGAEALVCELAEESGRLAAWPDC